jgi:hypothetical protein
VIPFKVCNTKNFSLSNIRCNVQIMIRRVCVVDLMAINE